ncbi:F-box/LRR-repeat protein At4g29420 isoform X1 [Physcomitrium patens]|uniref:F-box/LRR-repeat protein 15/At3g58940/PEG3-like LRR domain-containing protein n=1 Tax=Physcomitrium patens TaxID=3218 RepID=A0A7I4BTA7_PHYPA|nr:uncharacterized protein LOC112286647 isoform X1 [Physcomitrium patens]|eukprot:XP_024384501.1 uncharacterized protein LOC112286647 isoform X1 [Physcomitrella patens]
MMLSKGWCQEHAIAPASNRVLDGSILATSLAAIISRNVAEEIQPLSVEEALPIHVLSDIINKVKDARDLANCRATSKTMKEVVREVRCLNLVCLKRYYELARKRYPVRPQCSYSDTEDEDDMIESDSDESEEDEDDDDCCEMSQVNSNRGYQNGCCANSSSFSNSSLQHTDNVSFKNACLKMLRCVGKVEQLRIEVDQEMQDNPLLKEEIHMVDFWLSEPMFVRKWVYSCGHSLQHLTVIDYGQQAIMRQSPILRILSEQCKQLVSLELRNMYLDTSDLEVMPKMKSLTLRCIKMTERSLTEINACMPELVILALVSVFGVQDAHFSSNKLEVLCLGLSTSAKVVDLHLPIVKKLQIKMVCPDVLRVHAPKLTYVAVCMENRDGSIVEFDDVTNLKELLFGASHFSTLSRLIRTNSVLEKVFLDVPCMALGGDGKWEGVIPQVPLQIPDIESLKELCPFLHTLSVGPGLWHSMEQSLATNQELTTFRTWPALSRLIVHMVALSLESCVALLLRLVSTVPSLQRLEIYVHLDSPVKPDQLRSTCQEHLAHTNLQWGTWRRSLNFACFSF